MNLLITGGTGFVGQHLVSQLTRRELFHKLAVRSQVENPSNYKYISVGDINSRTPWAQAFKGVSLYLDSAKIRQELSWTPPFSIQAGLAETVQWFLKAQDSSASS